MGSTIWSISKEEKKKLITMLAPELVVLRAKAGISQEELSDLIGVSRQTYSAIERGAKQMSWSTFLSLILFYDCNQKTHQVLRSIKAIPQEVMLAFNAGNTAKDVNLDGHDTTSLDVVTEGRKSNAVVTFDSGGDKPPLHTGDVITISQLKEKKSSTLSILHRLLSANSANKKLTQTV